MASPPTNPHYPHSPHYPIDETHDPTLESWVESANDPGTDFPIQNLPLCHFLRKEHRKHATDNGLGVPIGDLMVQIGPLAEARLFDGIDGGNGIPLGEDLWMPEGLLLASKKAHRGFRHRLSELLRSDNSELQSNKRLLEVAVMPLKDVRFTVPALTPRDYTDFYASLYHATSVGSMFRPDNPLLPNYKHVPIGYHGRASSIVASGTQVRRPVGQQAPAQDGGNPTFGPCKMLDYELEVGVVVGRGNTLGDTIPIGEAEAHMLGLCLVNDWSARDLQKWEYQPLGPFLAKSFATTVSPYIVTMEALAPFRVPAFQRDAGDPSPLPYLTSEANSAAGGFDITLEVFLTSEQMRQKKMEPVRISRGNFKDMYWTLAQMLTHHASNGCNMQPGDLLASGTVSGKTRDSRGCLLELTWNGDAFASPPKLVPGTDRTPIILPTGEERKFLADGDEVILKGYCQREGFRRIGFGECRGIITPARTIERPALP
ncbi:MAG: fumarylacetoacetase [Phycisphaeraceae bacterium]|nr:fumarylacetoacetase [Phycisphaeraceae bacterium]